MGCVAFSVLNERSVLSLSLSLPLPLLFLKESLKNAERFPGDTNEKLLEMRRGMELKGKVLRETPPVALGPMQGITRVLLIAQRREETE